MNFKSQWLPYVTDADIAAVKRLSRSTTDDLKARINAYDPHNLFEEAGDSRNPDKRKIICPICGNGKGRDATPVEVEFKGDRWLYHCFRECGFQGDLLKIIADEERLNLHDFNDMCKALAIGAQLIGYPLDSNFTHSTKKKKSPPEKKRETPASELSLIQMDIADSQNHLDELPVSDRRGLTLETYHHFGCGYLDKWSHPKIRLEKGKAFPTRRIIIPTADKAHYLAALPLSDHNKTEKNIAKHLPSWYNFQYSRLKTLPSHGRRFNVHIFAPLERRSFVLCLIRMITKARRKIKAVKRKTLLPLIYPTPPPVNQG